MKTFWVRYAEGEALTPIEAKNMERAKEVFEKRNPYRKIDEIIYRPEGENKVPKLR